MQIVIDTREQKPYRIDGAKFKALAVGDYSLEGLENKFAIERKSLADIYQSLTRDHDRFRREIEKAKDFLDFVILIEARAWQFVDTHRNGRFIHPQSIMGAVRKWRKEYGVRWAFVENAKMGKRFAVWQLKNWFEEHQAGLWEKSEGVA